MIDAPKIGFLRSGPRDSIADVAGVTVGHATLADDGVQTGVTVVRPHAGDAYRAPVPAAAVVINGFGKTAGLVQLNELGLLESPIALTNTFAVGTIYTAMVRHAVAANPAIGRTAPTLNPVVGECNDGWLNDLQRFVVQEAHYAQAFDDAGADFAQGAVGAGRGMSCFGVKGGIGSASRMVQAGGQRVTLGALVLANFGRPAALTVRGVHLGRLLTQATPDGSGPDRGSIIVVLASDARLDHRQLRRLAMRAAAGIARTGSSFGHGSGDIAIAFASSGDSALTANPRTPAASNVTDDALDPLFDAASEATEQSIVHALFAAQTITGYAGRVRRALTEQIPHWRTFFADGTDRPR
ncbi:MAG TPA: P1 family peptidase [Casimicrobiaceae bacterium]|nr:P1 family peptidase [Casimicrobiaceae bacterium]